MQGSPTPKPPPQPLQKSQQSIKARQEVGKDTPIYMSFLNLDDLAKRHVISFLNAESTVALSQTCQDNKDLIDQYTEGIERNDTMYDCLQRLSQIITPYALPGDMQLASLGFAVGNLYRGHTYFKDIKTKTAKKKKYCIYLNGVSCVISGFTHTHESTQTHYVIYQDSPESYTIKKYDGQNQREFQDLEQLPEPIKKYYNETIAVCAKNLLEYKPPNLAGGAPQKFKYNKRWYKVRTGERGGRFILVDGGSRKIYLK